MAKANRGRVVAIALSIAVHAVVLTALARHSPYLRGPLEAAGPPEPIIPVLLMPRAPPPAPASPQAAMPTTITLHHRPARAPPPDSLIVQPLVTPAVTAPPPPPPAAPAPVPQGPVLLPKAAVPALAALRHGRLGCANPDAYNLSREERDRCNDALGAGLRDVPLSPGLGLAGDKEDALDKAAALQAAARRSREAPMPVGTSQGGPGSSAADMAARMGAGH